MASSSSTRVSNYDVFLSFRGQDTRKTFVSHLHNALVTRGIDTFKDDPELNTGDSISDELRIAIETSRFAIVVISKNYASSRWCLDELQLIMELKMKKEIKVVPIFYGVEPSDVRHQRGSFALDRYQGPGMTERVLGWREALTLIADLKGEVSSLCKDEAVMIEDIVRRISSRLLSMLPVDFGNIVGMKSQMEQINPLLDMDSEEEVRMIGICGMGGIGKTTIAKYIYEQLRHQFSSHCCFIQNVRETSAKHGLIHLQELLLSKILDKVDEKLWSVEQGANQIKSRLRKRKVFIILDDVDDVKQLNALVEEPTWFGKGSRIIITTGDKSVLHSCHAVYNVKCLGKDDALQLFQQIAFKGGCPSIEYKNLSGRASELCQGLPLALEALGLYLRGKFPQTWKNASKSIEAAPYENITNVLKVSYDRLNEVGKTTFLHVACLFNGDPVWRAMALLDSGELGISLLAEKSLIDISNDGYIAMHVLVENMGRKIVRLESANRPSEQRILWDPKDIYPVLEDNTGTSKIEGLRVHFCEMPYTSLLDWNVIKPMYNLTFLKICQHFHLSSSWSRNLKRSLPVPYQLRLLHWDSYPFTTLPSTIRLEYLVEINLCYSKLRTLWSETPRLLHLRRLDMTGSKSLKELPYLQEAECLEELILTGCTSLKRIPTSIFSLPKLKTLDVFNCDGVKSLIIIRESESTELLGGSSGQCLRVRGIHVVFHQVKEEQCVCLTNLSVKGNIKIELDILGGYAEHFCFISEQDIPHEMMMLENKTPKLRSPPYSFKSLDIMRFSCSKKSDPFVCYSFSDFPWLTELNLINLNIERIPDDIQHMQFLEKLDLSGNDFTGLPTSMTHLPRLKHLTLCSCRKLEDLPELYHLEKLILSDCTTLRALVNLPHREQDQNRYCLAELWLDNCQNVQSLSDQLTWFNKLTYLDISRHEFVSVPTSIKDLSSLVTLCLNYCKKLKSLKQVLPLSLKYLYAHGCESLDTSIDLHIDHSDFSPCFQWKQDSTQITRFPVGRRSEEVPVCSCFQENKMPSMKQVTRNPVPILLHRLKTLLWCVPVLMVTVQIIIIVHNSANKNVPGNAQIAVTYINLLLMFFYPHILRNFQSRYVLVEPNLYS